MEEPTVADVRRQFPDWTVYQGTDRRWRARLANAKPPTQVVVGEDLSDLMDEIRRRIAKLDEEAWRVLSRRSGDASS
jgi:hypothetical protein